LQRVRTRWLPDGSFAVIGELWVPRPALGAARRRAPDAQPLPLKAWKETAKRLASLEGEAVEIRGVLRRRYFRRDGEPFWGQLEIWVTDVQTNDKEHRDG